MIIFASILIIIGIFLGIVAIVATDGGLACVVSIAVMTGGTLLLQAAQRRVRVMGPPVTNEGNGAE